MVQPNTLRSSRIGLHSLFLLLHAIVTGDSPETAGLYHHPLIQMLRFRVCLLELESRQLITGLEHPYHLRVAGEQLVLLTNQLPLFVKLAVQQKPFLSLDFDQLI